MGAFPVFSTIYPRIKAKMEQRGGNNSPMSKDGGGGVSGLTPWIRIISASGTSSNSSNGGLVLQSIHNGDGFTARYGNYEYKDGENTIEQKSGILGYQLDMKTPVNVTGRPLRPSPIINSVSIDEADIGKRNISFNIVAYTLEHMEKLAEYFLEPGFYVLVEWGWNTTKARSQWVGKSNPGGAITPCDIASHHNWKVIAAKRSDSDYDYDATLGVITGGGIEFGDNETYILKVQLTSIGEVAEYMQTHKDATSSTNSTQKSAKPFKPKEIESFSEGTDNPTGKALFAQMVNMLPAPKQTTAIKDLMNKKQTKFLFTDQSSYVNMDIVILDNLLKNWHTSTSLVSKEAGNLKIPSDEPLLSEERFIRFELAIGILNNYAADLSAERKSNNKSTCDKYKIPLLINIENTICTAYTHMFSTDKTKLYIPNPKAPKFGLIDAFSPNDAKTDFIFDKKGKISETQNLHPKTVYGSYSGTRAKNGTYGDVKVPHAFPSNYTLNKEDNAWNEIDETIQPLTAPLGHWGWLKNLYVNFDFFCEVLKTPNYTQRDVLYDLLNGMSGAVNSLWKFQIVERPNQKSGTNELQVVDMNFTGDVSTISKSGITTFQSRGTKSPFLESNFSINVPGAMMNSVIQKRFSNDQNYVPNPDVNPQPVIGQVFSNKTDSVGTIISGISYQDVTTDDTGKTVPQPSAPNEDDIRLANYEFFLGKAGVFPKIQHRNAPYDVIKEGYDMISSNDSTIERVFIVGTWDDTMALQQVMNYDLNILDNGETTPKAKISTSLNAPYGTARFDFKVHGLSGFKRGDVLRIDGIPKNYGSPHFWQVDGLEHSIDSSGWFVSVKTGLRPASGNDNIDE